MATAFPTILDDNTNLPNPGANDLLTNTNPVLQHAYQHDTVNDALKALEAKVGINGSADTNSLDYKLAHPASSGGGVSIVAALPTADVTTRGKLFLLESAAYTGPAYDPTIEAESSLIAYYPLNEAAGQSSIHDAKSGPIGTFTGGVTLGQPGRVSDTATAAGFDGTTGGITITNPTLVSARSQNFTIEAWINWSGSTKNGCWFDAGDGYAGDTGFVLLITPGGALKSGNNSAGIDQTQDLNKTLVPNTWYHLVMVQDGTTTTIYVNGSIAIINNSTYYLNNYGHNYIGWHQYYNYIWTGKIQKVGIYNASLTSTQVSNHYAIGAAAATNDELYLGIQKADGSYALRHMLGS